MGDQNPQNRANRRATAAWADAVLRPTPTPIVILAVIPVLVTAMALSTAFLLPAGASAGDPAWKDAPVVPVINGRTSSRLRHDVKVGRELGLRARVFAKVGDSNTEATPVLYGLACEKARLAGRRHLADVINRYSRVRVANGNPMPGCRPWNSFSRRSAAVKSGSFSDWSLRTVSELPDSGYYAAPEECDPDETPLTCELRILRPRYVFVMTGSNDIGLDYLSGVQPGTLIGTRLGPMIKAIRAAGSVPVLSTIPPIPKGPIGWEAAVKTSEGIWRLARRRHVPLVNLWRALTGPGMINSGIDVGDLHLSVFRETGETPILTPGPTTYRDSVDFRPEALRYGANKRNLIWLKTLRKLDRVVRTS